MRAVIYIRVSTLDQAREGYSLAAQERTLRKHCADKGDEVVAVYADEGISGKDITHRPAMRQLIADAQSKSFDVVCVWALSRFTRSVADLYTTCDLLTRNGIALTSYTEAFDTGTAVGRAMLGILGVFAQMEREITAERVKAAMQERAIQGHCTCSAVLGYDYTGEGLTVNETEAEVVRFIFNLYANCGCYSEVAKACNAKGYRGKRGGAFAAESIKKIIQNPIYEGYYSYKGNTQKGNFKPIVAK